MTVLADEPPSIQALGALIATSADWQLSRGSTQMMSIYVRAYPDGWADVLVVLGEYDANGHREDPDGFSVWRCAGGLAEVADALRGLPPPQHPHTPTLALPGREYGSVWTPPGF